MSRKFPVIGISRLRMETDGEGVTTLVASYGCTLRCRYCLNPHCFSEASFVREYCVEELIDSLMVDDLYFRATNGGIIFGGGEPLLQAEFIHEFRAKCPVEWRIYLETSLNVPREMLETVIQDVDSYIVDCKDMNMEIYEAYTGKSNTDFIENLRYLIERVGAGHIVVRVPQIPEYNTIADCKRSVEQLKRLGITQVDRLVYNTEIGEKKRQKG